MEKMRVKLTFIDEILGTASSDPEIHRSYIASKGPDATTIEEELETLTVDEVTSYSDDKGFELERDIRKLIDRIVSGNNSEQIERFADYRNVVQMIMMSI